MLALFPEGRWFESWKVPWTYIFLCHIKLSIFGKNIIKKFLVAKNTYFYLAPNAGLLLFKPGWTSTRLFRFVTTLTKWSRNQINFSGFLLRQYLFGWFVPRDVGIGGQCGVIPFFCRNSNFLIIHAKPHFFSRSRPSFDSLCEPCIVLKKIVNVFCLQIKILSNTPFFLDCLKRLLVVQILENTVYQENAEHIRLIIFHWQSETVEMGGTCLGEQKSIQSKVVFNSW